MLVFSTRLPIKKEVTREDCAQLFIDWVTKSPNYNIDSIPYDISSQQDYEYKSKNITFSIRHFNNEQIDLCACRLENRESIAVWTNDCILLCENGKKSLLVQLNCTRIDYNTQLPHIHKPHIVRMFVENGLCRDDNGIPITDTPIESDTEHYKLCTEIISGTYDYSMPVVYISYDHRGKIAIKPEYLAQKLSGVAHVFVEKNDKTSQKLKKDTDGKNVYNGYAGIYFPNSKLCQRYGIENYNNDVKEMTNEIIRSVWKALINRLDSSTYDWNQIVALQARQKMNEWQDISAQDRKELDEYMDTFDQENKGLREKIDELNRQNYSLRAQLSTCMAAMNDASDANCFYRSGAEPELYAGERNDLLYSILSQVQDKFSVNSRAQTIIQSLLEANPRQGECAKIISTVRNILGNGAKLSKTDKGKLSALGFSIDEDGPHYKLVFHDSRYMVTLPKTPSDHREGKNLISHICNVIDVEKKI